MGESTFFLSIVFDKPLSKTKQRLLRRFFGDLIETSEKWHAARESPPSSKPSGEEFMRHTLQLVYLYLLPYFKGNLQDLTGLLDFGTKNELVRHLKITKKALNYQAHVWHCANWEPLKEFIVSIWGGFGVWVSEEYAQEAIQVGLYYQAKLLRKQFAATDKKRAE